MVVCVMFAVTVLYRLLLPFVLLPECPNRPTCQPCQTGFRPLEILDSDLFCPKLVSQIWCSVLNLHCVRCGWCGDMPACCHKSSRGMDDNSVHSARVHVNMLLGYYD